MKKLPLLLIPMITIACARPNTNIRITNQMNISPIHKVGESFPEEFLSKWINQGLYASKTIRSNGAKIQPIESSSAFEASKALTKYFVTKLNFENEMRNYLQLRIPNKIEVDKRNNFSILITSVDISNRSQITWQTSSEQLEPLDLSKFDITPKTELVSEIRMYFKILDGSGLVLFEGISKGVASGVNSSVGKEHPDYQACVNAMNNLGWFITTTP